MELELKMLALCVKQFEQALEMLDAGANRIGASSGVTIVTDGEE